VSNRIYESLGWTGSTSTPGSCSTPGIGSIPGNGLIERLGSDSAMGYTKPNVQKRDSVSEDAAKMFDLCLEVQKRVHYKQQCRFGT
jgi:hypothetical protein